MRCRVSQFAHLSCYVFVILPIKAHDTNACISMHAHNVNDWLNTLLLPLKPVSYPTSYWKHNATLKNKVWALRKGQFKVQRSIRARGFRSLVGYRISYIVSGSTGYWPKIWPLDWMAENLFVSLRTTSVYSDGSATTSPEFSTGGGNGKDWITDVWLSATGTLESLIWSRCRSQTKLGPISIS